MKITRARLRQIIKEEVQRIAEDGMYPNTGDRWQGTSVMPGDPLWDDKMVSKHGYGRPDGPANPLAGEWGYMPSEGDGPHGREDSLVPVIGQPHKEFILVQVTGPGQAKTMNTDGMQETDVTEYPRGSYDGIHGSLTGYKIFTGRDDTDLTANTNPQVSIDVGDSVEPEFEQYPVDASYLFILGDGVTVNGVPIPKGQYENWSGMVK